MYLESKITTNGRSKMSVARRIDQAKITLRRKTCVERRLALLSQLAQVIYWVDKVTCKETLAMTENTKVSCTQYSKSCRKERTPLVDQVWNSRSKQCTAKVAWQELMESNFTPVFGLSSQMEKKWSQWRNTECMIGLLWRVMPSVRDLHRYTLSFSETLLNQLSYYIRSQFIKLI